jgi:hypothetical protein
MELKPGDELGAYEIVSAIDRRHPMPESHCYTIAGANEALSVMRDRHTDRQ